MAQYGLQPGARVRLESSGNQIQLHRPVTHLTKVYIEPTDMCNITCRTCIRNNWNEAMGRMRDDTFDRILQSVQKLSPVPTIFFGGLGEPLFHKQIVDWIVRAKVIGARVELITNGTMLTEKRSRELIDAGLDLIWVSIDGATPESYADVRLGAELPKILANVSRFRKMRRGSHHPKPEIGIAFVAMARNIHELPQVLHIGRSLGAKHFSVSNVLPYTAEMQEEVLYKRTVRDVAYLDSPWHAKLNLPRMDINDQTGPAFLQALQSDYNVTFAGNSLGGATDVCSFIESGTISVSWDGAVSPCWPLMHTHTSYLHGKPHASRRHVVGNVHEQELMDIWMGEAYQAYRQRVQSFAFAPCTFCGGCELSEANEEDCFGNEFPACGGCLWAQGVIQCP
jgi:MoaA/NifB/PqqE/SkfB family radical SAM enzyme